MHFMESISVIGGADGPTSIFLAGVIETQILIVSIIIGLLLCVFGLRLMRVLSALVGLLTGAGIGFVIAVLAGLEGTISLAVIIGCGLLIAALSFLLRRVGAFFSVFLYSFGALASIFPLNSKIFMIVAVVIALILAVLAAIYLEPLVVIVSSLAGGMIVGTSVVMLIGLDTKMWIGYIIGIVLAVIGVFVQLLMQSKKIKDNDKKHAQDVKEQKSRESEVEKARNALDAEEIEVEEMEL